MTPTPMTAPRVVQPVEMLLGGLVTRRVRVPAREVVFVKGVIEASEGDKVLVDATTFFLRDAHGVIETMRRARQGSFRMDEARSAFYLPRTKSFPKNTEIEVTLTFAGDEPGRLVAEVVPTAQAVTVREHFSLVELPDRNYTPRPLDPHQSRQPRAHPERPPHRRLHAVLRLRRSNRRLL